MTGVGGGGCRHILFLKVSIISYYIKLVSALNVCTLSFKGLLNTLLVYYL